MIDDGDIQADHTPWQIKDAYEAGTSVYCKVGYDQKETLCELSQCTGDDDEIRVVFRGYDGTSLVRVTGLLSGGTNAWDFYSERLPRPVAATDNMTQEVGMDDEGKLRTAPGGGGTDVALGITGASVGQIPRITAVDAEGKPTAWEAVDMPSGGAELFGVISSGDAVYPIDGVTVAEDGATLTLS